MKDARRDVRRRRGMDVVGMRALAHVMRAADYTDDVRVRRVALAGVSLHSLLRNVLV